MTFVFTLSACAILCAAAVLWVLTPMRASRAVYVVALALAVSSLALYLGMGRPDLPATTAMLGHGAEEDYRKLVLDEFELMKEVSNNPNDADALVRLAAVRLAQGRDGEQTMRLLARAEMLDPKNPRLLKIKKVLAK